MSLLSRLLFRFFPSFFFRGLGSSLGRTWGGRLGEGFFRGRSAWERGTRLGVFCRSSGGADRAFVRWPHRISWWRGGVSRGMPRVLVLGGVGWGSSSPRGAPEASL